MTDKTIVKVLTYNSLEVAISSLIVELFTLLFIIFLSYGTKEQS